MQADKTNDLEHNNFKMFLHTVNSLKHSQGFYSRLANNIESMTQEEFENVKDYFNSLPQKFNDTLDVVLFLEQ